MKKGRPRKPLDENKTRRVVVRLNQAEDKDWQEKADKHFQGKLSRLIRFCVKHFKE